MEESPDDEGLIRFPQLSSQLAALVIQYRSYTHQTSQ